MRYVLPIALLLASLPAAADDTGVYESVDEVTIGRVFLTPGERRWLDANRHLMVRGVPAESTAAAEEADDAPAPEPAGFIINSSGQARRYQNGGFAPSAEPPSEIRFPDEVEIRRHEPRRAADDEQDPDRETPDR